MSPREIQAIYLDWLNNYLTIETFADHHGYSDKFASALIAQGREFHQMFTES